MVTLAALGARFVGQFREQPIDGIQIVWSGVDGARFAAEVPALKPRVVLVDVSDSGGLDEESLRQLLETVKPDLALLTYDFARRKFLRALQTSTRARVLQTPVSVDTLRAHLAPLLVLANLRAGLKEMGTMSDAPRYTREQLGRLMELTSSIQCECPNHVAQIVEKLQAFEAYSLDCTNRDEKDRAVHQSLYETTQAARREMEKALSLLVAHEKIELSR